MADQAQSGDKRAADGADGAAPDAKRPKVDPDAPDDGGDGEVDDGSPIGKSILHGGMRTPFFVIDRSIMAANCGRVLDQAARLGLRIRPHVKTHKTTEGTAIMHGGAAAGADQAGGPIVVSTFAEAAFFADRGYSDILYGFPLSPNKFFDAAVMTRREGLAFHIILDSDAALDRLTEFTLMQGNKAPAWSVWVKIGTDRCGLDSHADATVAFVERVAASEHTTLTGIYGHAGQSYHAASLEEVIAIAKEEFAEVSRVAARVADKGISPGVVSIGSTPTCSVLEHISEEDRGLVTEIHPGNYALYDLTQADVGSCRVQDIACWVVASVAAHYPDRNRVLVDAGGLAMSKDTGSGNHGYGDVRGDANHRLVGVSQEHGMISTVDGSPVDFGAFELGSAVCLLPNHSCMMAAAHDRYLIVDGDDRVVDVWTPAKFW